MAHHLINEKSFGTLINLVMLKLFIFFKNKFFNNPQKSLS